MPKLVAHGLTPGEFNALQAQGGAAAPGIELLSPSGRRRSTRRLKSSPCDSAAGGGRAPWPETSATLFSQLSYDFMGSLLALGAVPGRTLGGGDLFAVPEDESSAVLSAAFRREFWDKKPLVQTMAAKAVHAGVSQKKAAASAEDAAAEASEEVAEAGFRQLVVGLWAIVRPVMIEAGWCNLVACAMQVRRTRCGSESS